MNPSPPKKKYHLSMELELVIGTIKKVIKSTTSMHILIFDINFQEKVKIIFYFQWFLHNFFTFYPKILNAPTAQWLILYRLSEKYIYPCKIPLGEGVYCSSSYYAISAIILLSRNRLVHNTIMR